MRIQTITMTITTGMVFMTTVSVILRTMIIIMLWFGPSTFSLGTWTLHKCGTQNKGQGSLVNGSELVTSQRAGLSLAALTFYNVAGSPRTVPETVASERLYWFHVRVGFPEVVLGLQAVSSRVLDSGRTRGLILPIYIVMHHDLLLPLTS